MCYQLPATLDDNLSSRESPTNNNQHNPAISLNSGQELMAQGPAAFLDLVAQKLEPALGRALPQMEVRCKELSVVADVTVVEQYTGTATSELPTITNSLRHTLRHLTAQTKTAQKRVLNRVNAVFEPGTITLVLGQPGSGKTSLMKMLSGQLPMANISVEGEVFYNGRSWKEVETRLPQLAAYVPQSDKHFPMLTVQETLEFAHACSSEELASKRGKKLLSQGTPEQNEEALNVTRALYRHYPDVIVEQLGLQTCQDTVLGGALRRGVSGGERRRVTTGEMEFGMKYATFMDEVSTGLDSSATFDIVATQRSIAKKLHKTVVMALLQPAPEVFELFDNILLLKDGEVMYNGPRDQAVPYFRNLGFECPPDRDVADYLLDLGTSQQQQYEVLKTEASSLQPSKTPLLASEFAELFRDSDIYRETMRTLNAPWKSERLRDAEMHMAHMPEFRQSFWASTLVLTRRQLVIARRNTSFLRVRAFMVIVMGFIFSTLFYQTNPRHVQVAMGVLFQGTMFLQMGQASQIPTFVTAREMYYKQRRANMYRTSSFALACSIALIPTALAEILVFGSLMYWMCGFLAHAGVFMMFLLLLLLTNTVFVAWYFFLAAWTPNFNVAKPISMFSSVFFMVFAGFVVTPDKIPTYLVWMYWVNPVAWCVRAMVVNQYRSAHFDVCVYDDEDYCAQFGMTFGKYALSEYAVPADKAWVWTSVLYLLFAYAFFMVLGWYALEYKRYDNPVASAALVRRVTKGADKAGELQTEPERQHHGGGVAYALALTPRQLTTSSSGENDNGDTLGDVVLDVSNSKEARFVPVTLAFRDLWYSVPSSSNRKESIDLLKGISGYALPGTMTALMGSSGAGKTTLMDVIAGRKTGGSIKGQILLNGYPATGLAVRRCTGYCEQMDIHSEASTIREALTFSALLRQDSSVSVSAKLASVEECLDLLDMHDVADEMIRGRSQEQMKRLTIGVELAAQPSVLFLDEPTSGLDSNSAKTIMDGVRKVADSGRTIVCTIHQPSSDVFFLFDNLLLLKRGGEMVFFGELDNKQTGRECGHLIDYFESIPNVPKLPEGQNPATWMLECIGAGVVAAGENAASDAIVVDFVRRFSESSEKQMLLECLDKPGVARPAPGEHKELVFKDKRAASSMTQLRVLVGRFFTMYWRTPSYNLTRWIIAMALALLFGLIFVGANYTSYHGMNSAVGVIFMTMLYNGISSYVGAIPFTSRERPSFYRERNAQTYSAFWYFVAGTLVEIPYVFFSGFIFTIIFYPLMGFTAVSTGILYWITISLFILVQTYMAQLLVFALPSAEVSIVVGMLVNAISLLFAGYNPPANEIPAGYRWIYTIVPHRYALSILVSIIFGECPHEPTYDESLHNYLRVGPHLGCQPVANAPLYIDHATVKDYVEDIFNLHRDQIPRNLGCLLAFITVYRVLALLTLRYINHQKR